MSDLIERQEATDALRKMQTYKLFSGDDMLLIDQAGAMTELMMLPSALSTNLAEVGTDCISRQAAIDEIDEWIKAFRENGHKESAADACLIQDGIIQLPPAQPKQRIGHWIPVGVAEVVGGESAMWGSAVAYHKCSECDEQALRDDFEQEVLSDFCPHCGVKMKGVAE